MEMSLPLPAIILFLTSLLIPADVNQVEITMEGKEITWTRDAKGAWKAEQPNPLGDITYAVVGDKTDTVLVSPGRDNNVKPYTLPMDEYLVFAEDLGPGYWKAVEKIPMKNKADGSDIVIRRAPAKNQISLSQETGPLSDNPVIISWKTAVKPKE